MTKEELELIFRENEVADKKAQLKAQRKANDIALEQSAENDFYKMLYSRESESAVLSDFKRSVTDALVTESIVCLVSSCIDSIILKEEYNQTLVRQLATNFVQEEGSFDLLNRFKSASYMLSELAYVINNSVTSIMEKADPKDKSSLTIDKKDKEKFFKSLDNVSADKAIDTIRNRVMNATQKFIDSNTKGKMEIKNVLANTKEKIEKSREKANGAALAESHAFIGQRQIMDIREGKVQNVLEAMVYAVSRQALKNEDAKKIFVENASLNMDKVVEHCEVMFTFLTTLDTCKIANIDEAYIEEMLNDLKS